jgi:hypothetical protein
VDRAPLDDQQQICDLSKAPDTLDSAQRISDLASRLEGKLFR